jgi:hypothetical protein
MGESAAILRAFLSGNVDTALGRRPASPLTRPKTTGTFDNTVNTGDV